MKSIHNYKIITAPILVRGIPRIGWLLNMIISAVILNLFGLYGAVLTFICMYIFLFIYSKKDPDFLNINAIKNIKIEKTKTSKSFKGNRYVS